MVTKVGFLCTQGKGYSVKIKLTPKIQTNRAFPPTQESLRINECRCWELQKEKTSFLDEKRVLFLPTTENL